MSSEVSKPRPIVGAGPQKTPVSRFVIFSLIGLVVMGGLAVLLSFLTAMPLKNEVVDHAVRDAGHMSGMVARYLKPEDLNNPMTGQRLQDFDKLMRDNVVSQDAGRIKLWNKNAIVIYSDDFSQIGSSHPEDKDLLNAIGGKAHGEITKPETTENQSEKSLGTVIEVYTPVRLPESTEIGGVVEIYESYAPFGALITQQQRTVLGANMLGLVVLYATLMILAYYTWKQLSRQRLVLTQKAQEAAAASQFNVGLLNERVKILEETERHKGRLAHLSLAITLAQGAPGPIEMGRGVLKIIQQDVGAEFASLTLVRPDGSLGERVDSFEGIQPFSVFAHPGGLSEAVLTSGRTQYLADTVGNSRANPALVASGIRSYIGVAIRTEEQLEGILFLHSTKVDAFANEKSFLESFASVCAMPMQRARLLSYIENAKQELEDVFDSIPSGVVLVDEERHILRANMAFARLVKLQVESVIGPSVCKLLHGREERLHRCPLDKAFVSSQSEVIAFREPHLGNVLLNVRTYPVEASAQKGRRLVLFFTPVKE